MRVLMQETFLRVFPGVSEDIIVLFVLADTVLPKNGYL